MYLKGGDLRCLIVATTWRIGRVYLVTWDSTGVVELNFVVERGVELADVVQ